ncbi:hypothetical protein F4861DRAFT_438052 [Xylaria intraflava]|nr:hypothetical protein F4861DRAFT_438052 [Xylaria intraflava]
MTFINQAFVDGVHVVARAVEHQARQATSSAIASASTPVPSSTADPSPSPTGNDNKNNNTGNSTSPLLFFVALGFGVVFTNLWIIVGVKYCFRYNARNRAMARLDENGDPIDLQNMPARPHRRRREKKLMTMDEVNEKFPMVKYKTWVLDRKREGLPTTGGISAPPSRANSVRSVDGIVPEQPRLSSDSTTNPPKPESNTQNESKPTDKEQQKPDGEMPNAVATEGTGNSETSTTDAHGVTAETVDESQNRDTLRRASKDDEDEDDDDDHVNPALDPDMMGSSGDTCAICIDTLEDNDDVRGLTCGHAFHAVCLDPWLTNRRACCPLCKADYYTPKVRAQVAEGEARDPNAAGTVDPSRNNDRMNYPRPPVRSFAWSHFRDAPRQIFPNRFNTSRDPPLNNHQHRARRNQVQTGRRNMANQAQSASPEASSGNFVIRFRDRFPPFVLNQVMRRNRDGLGTESRDTRANRNTAASAPTPSQLEAGVQPSTSQAN